MLDKFSIRCLDRLSKIKQNRLDSVIICFCRLLNSQLFIKLLKEINMKLIWLTTIVLKYFNKLLNAKKNSDLKFTANKNLRLRYKMFQKKSKNYLNMFQWTRSKNNSARSLMRSEEKMMLFLMKDRSRLIEIYFG
jgi:hypothetical protein